MKPEFLLAKLDRMPMLKAVVPFAAGILAADRFALPLWFLAGAFLLSGVLALLLRSPLCTEKLDGDGIVLKRGKKNFRKVTMK